MGIGVGMVAPVLPGGIELEGLFVLVALIPMSDPPHADSTSDNAISGNGQLAHRRCRIGGNLELTGASPRSEICLVMPWQSVGARGRAEGLVYRTKAL
jgi:hypothetical protein